MFKIVLYKYPKIKMYGLATYQFLTSLIFLTFNVKQQ